MTERLLALAVLVASGVYVFNSLPLPRGTAARPGPGLFPLAVGVFGTVIALAWTLSAFRRARVAAADHTVPAEGRERVVATTGALAGFCVLLPWTGYPVAAFAFSGLMLRWLGASWSVALTVGLGSAVASYYLFGVLLGVPLPRGPFFD